MKVIKFYSPTCGPCKVLEKNLSTAGIEHDSVNVIESSNSGLLDIYNVTSIPTLVVVKEDGSFKSYNGILSVEQLKEICNEID